jgi:hypothetical protein
LALATNGPGGPLAGPVARHGLDLLYFAHGRGPYECVEKPMAAKVLKPTGGHEVSARASKGVERARGGL